MLVVRNGAQGLALGALNLPSWRLNRQAHHERDLPGEVPEYGFIRNCYLAYVVCQLDRHGIHNCRTEFPNRSP
jgi:hypothetical protein